MPGSGYGRNAIAVSKITGFPFVTVSPVGIAAGYPVNNGADYGPDTPGTTTSGIQEAINSLLATGGTIFLLNGDYVGTSTIVINPNLFANGSLGLSIIGESFCPVNIASNNVATGVRYTLNSPTSPKAALSVLQESSGAPTFSLILRNLLIVPTYPGSGGYAAPVVDIEITALESLVIEDCGFGLPAEGTTTNPPPSGSVGLQIGVTNSNGFVQGGTLKRLVNVACGFVETGFKTSCDWLTFERCVASGYNLAGFVIGYGGSAPIMNRLVGCHAVYGAGYGVKDLTVTTNTSSPYHPVVEDFYLEEPKSGGSWIATPSVIFPSLYGRYCRIVNVSNLPDFPTSIATGFWSPGIPSDRIGFGTTSGAAMSSTDATWNRWASSLPTLSGGISYRNVNAALMRVRVTVELTPTAGAAATAELGTSNTDPHAGTTYPTIIHRGQVPAGVALDSVYLELEISVPPLWWFCLNLTNAALINWDVTYDPIDG